MYVFFVCRLEVFCTLLSHLFGVYPMLRACQGGEMRLETVNPSLTICTPENWVIAGRLPKAPSSSSLAVLLLDVCKIPGLSDSLEQVWKCTIWRQLCLKWIPLIYKIVLIKKEEKPTLHLATGWFCLPFAHPWVFGIEYEAGDTFVLLHRVGALCRVYALRRPEASPCPPLRGQPHVHTSLPDGVFIFPTWRVTAPPTSQLGSEQSPAVISPQGCVTIGGSHECPLLLCFPKPISLAPGIQIMGCLLKCSCPGWPVQWHQNPASVPSSLGVIWYPGEFQNDCCSRVSKALLVLPSSQSLSGWAEMYYFRVIFLGYECLRIPFKLFFSLWIQFCGAKGMIWVLVII